MVTHEQIIIEFVAKGIENTKKGMEQVNQAVGKTNKQIFTARQVMGMNIQEFKRFNELGPQMATRGGRMVNTFRRLTHGMRGFRMEMLGVMFFGMAMQRMFMGLLQPAMEVAGIFEIFSTMLQVLFLPVALALLDPLLSLMDWFLGMPEWGQGAIGVVVLLGAAIGTLLFLVGTLALGLGSIIQVFGPLLGGMAKAGAAGSAFGGVISSVGGGLLKLAGFISGPVLAAVGLLYIAWVNNSEKISQAVFGMLRSVTRVFTTMGNTASALVRFLHALFTLDAKRAFDALKDIAMKTIQHIVEFFLVLPGKIFAVFWEIEYGIGKFFVGLPAFFADLGSRLAGSLLGGFNKGLSGFAGVLMGNIGGTISKTIGSPQALISGFRGFQHGGMVTSPTLALLGESGPEMVTPLGEGVGATTISPTYNITASISNDMDIRRLAERLNDLLTSDYRRLTYR